MPARSSFVQAYEHLEKYHSKTHLITFTLPKDITGSYLKSFCFAGKAVRREEIEVEYLTFPSSRLPVLTAMLTILIFKITPGFPNNRLHSAG